MGARGACVVALAALAAAGPRQPPPSCSWDFERPFGACRAAPLLPPPATTTTTTTSSFGRNSTTTRPSSHRALPAAALPRHLPADPYTILGVPPDSSTEAIRTAYRDIALTNTLHPLRQPSCHDLWSIYALIRSYECVVGRGAGEGVAGRCRGGVRVSVAAVPGISG